MVGGSSSRYPHRFLTTLDLARMASSSARIVVKQNTMYTVNNLSCRIVQETCYLMSQMLKELSIYSPHIGDQQSIKYMSRNVFAVSLFLRVISFFSETSNQNSLGPESVVHLIGKYSKTP
jgi:hypothetical protein